MISDADLDNELMRGLYEPKGFDKALHAPGVSWGRGFVAGEEADAHDRI